jgi:hypothetical protein
VTTSYTFVEGYSGKTNELKKQERKDASELLDRAMFLIERDMTKGPEWDYWQMDLRTHLRKWR